MLPLVKAPPNARTIKMTDPSSGEVVDYVPEPHQAVIHTSARYLRALIGGYGSGKTLCGCADNIVFAMNYDGAVLLDVSPSYTMAYRTIIETYNDLLDCTMPGRWNYNQQRHEITFADSRSKIIIASGDNPKSLKGPNITRARIDEPFIQDAEVYRQVRARIRLPVGPLGLLLTGTPEDLNWGYDIIHGAAESKVDAYGRERKPVKKCVVHASTLENRHAPEEFIDSLYEAYDAESVKAYVEGQFVSLNQKQAYYNFDSTTHVGEHNYDQNRTLYFTLDFNVEPFCANVIQQDGERDIVIDEIHIAKNGTTYRACDEFLAKYGKHRAGVTVTGDPAGAGRATQSMIGGYNNFAIVREKLSAMHGYQDAHVVGQCPVINSMNLVNGRLLNARDERQLFFDRRCTWTIKDFERVKRTNDGKIDKADESLTHHSDAVRYYLWRFRGRGRWVGA